MCIMRCKDWFRNDRPQPASSAHQFYGIAWKIWTLCFTKTFCQAVSFHTIHHHHHHVFQFLAIHFNTRIANDDLKEQRDKDATGQFGLVWSFWLQLSWRQAYSSDSDWTFDCCRPIWYASVTWSDQRSVLTGLVNQSSKSWYIYRNICILQV